MHSHSSPSHPRSLARSRHYHLGMNGVPVEVLHTGAADFAILHLPPDGADIEIRSDRPAAEAVVRPVSRGVSAEVEGPRTKLRLETPANLQVDFGPGHHPLYLFAGAPSSPPPEPDAKGVIRIPAGQTTEIPELTLEDGQTLYLPPGAVLKGRVHVKGKKKVRICGQGILDGSFHTREENGRVPLIVFDHCKDVVVEDITMVRPNAWMLVLAGCEDVRIRNVRQIGELGNSDGIDIVGSRQVRVSDCFLHNNDDCVVVKSLLISKQHLPLLHIDARHDVEDVIIERCVLANQSSGNAMEIGHELATDRIADITFRDLDVLSVHNCGAVFSIHNFDRALVEDIRFENIRIEHCYDKVVDFRIARSRYSTDTERGRIRNVLLKDILWTRKYYNQGYTTSVISGWDPDHRVEGVVFDNFRIDGRAIQSPDELELTTRYAEDIRVRRPEDEV